MLDTDRILNSRFGKGANTPPWIEENSKAKISREKV